MTRYRNATAGDPEAREPGAAGDPEARGRRAGPAGGDTPGERIVLGDVPPAARRRFGATWWSRAWLDALQQQALIDPNRLPRGRTYARSGAVRDAVVTAGAASARVRGSRPTAYRVEVRVATFDDAGWARVLDAIGGQLAHTAALLDGELPPSIVDDVAAAGLSLLPGPRELTVSCDCPDRAVPCKHAAALCYVLADLLDTDPFALLLLRGRHRTAVLAALRDRRGAASGTDGPAPPAAETVPATEAYARTPVPPPAPLPPPAEPGTPVPLPAVAGVDLPALTALASRAAQRAHELLS
ncbi:hypothetical protein Athai_00140 [Actinocatenispora thailandica]|uniref:SWIM-type domain-containing protein n=1 Tax=Actinocatenispora thailandica TaxID=227318 RepID=A0A7R7HUK2_9ACTN|nr:SWIM zinc finger family protein [Actinocatenispora thailandica]BCJ32511.1 hypothetical protein Athai_00140 [Actinocatenispora thailandica]